MQNSIPTLSDVAELNSGSVMSDMRKVLGGNCSYYGLCQGERMKPEPAPKPRIWPVPHFPRPHKPISFEERLEIMRLENEILRLRIAQAYTATVVRF